MGTLCISLKGACGKLRSAPTQIITPRGLRGMARRPDGGHFAVLLCSICINIPGLLSIKVPSALQFWVQIIYCNTKKRSKGHAVLTMITILYGQNNYYSVQFQDSACPTFSYYNSKNKKRKCITLSIKSHENIFSSYPKFCHCHQQIYLSGYLNMEHLDCNHIQSLMDYTFPAFCPVSFHF